MNPKLFPYIPILGIFLYEYYRKRTEENLLPQNPFLFCLSGLIQAISIATLLTLIF